MRFLRAALGALLILTFMPITTGWAAGSDNVYDRLKSGTKIMQDREYEELQQPTVYLTFDDGPSKLTPKVLDILKEEQVKATFFVLGSYVKQFPDYIKRMVEEGHSVGNHTYDHVYANMYPVFGTFWNEIQRTEQALMDAAGVNTNLVRAPGGTSGHFDAFYFYYMDQAGYSVFDWNVDSGDSARPNVPSSEILKGATATIPLKQQMIVLMHDSSGHDETVRTLPSIIHFYKEKGYRFATLSAQVKPIQQGLANSKLSSPISAEEHEQWMAKMQENAARKSANNVRLPDTISPSPAPSVPVPSVPVAVEQIQVPPLLVDLGNDTLEMDSPDYEFRQDKFYVPLRSLTEQMGAVVSWDGERRTASVQYGLYQMNVDLQHQSIAIQAPGKTKQVYHMADVSMHDGTVMVPLRSAVEMLGSRVVDYSLTDSMREVKVDLKAGGYGLLLPPRMFAIA